ncbi:MAG: HAD hydrolase family protein, partial [Clostridia bacterium]|nr:HAD hydrolase family protein [Clostridia bacterium]
RDGKISKENCDAIRFFQDNGGLFSLATGRGYDHSKFFLPDFRSNTHSICLNGSEICEFGTGRPLVSVPMCDTDRLMIDLRTIALGNPSVEEVYFKYHDEEICIGRDELFLPFDDRRIVSLRTIPVNCCTVVCEGLTKEYVRRQNLLFGGRYSFTRSWEGGFEMCSNASGKGRMLRILRTICGTPIHTTVAAGDFDNDVQMIEMADLGFAVENAEIEVKNAAYAIAPHHGDNAIAAIISHLKYIHAPVH